jgi:hypothetical protein
MIISYEKALKKAFLRKALFSGLQNRASAKVQWTVANWRKSSDVLAKVLWTLFNWRKYSNLSLVGK